jgi:hypothetical protein
LFCGLTLRYHKTINYQAAIFGGDTLIEAKAILKFTVFTLLLFSNWTYACSGRYIDNHFRLTGEHDIEKNVYNLAHLEVGEISLVNGSSVCPQDGQVKIAVSLSQGSEYDVSEIGFYLIPEAGSAKVNYLPSFPLKALKNSEGKYILHFNWFINILRDKQEKVIFRIHVVDRAGYISASRKIYTIN